LNTFVYEGTQIAWYLASRSFFYIFREFLTNIQANQMVVLRKIHIRTFLISHKSESDNA